MRLSLTLLLLAGLSACAPASLQKLSLTAEPAAVTEPQQAIVPTEWWRVPSTEAPAISLWWKWLNDDVLNTLVMQALQANPDILVAESRLGQIEATVAGADTDKQTVAQAALHASENDVRVIRQSVVHATVTTFLEARLAEQRREILHQRMQLARQLTETFHKRVTAGIGSTGALRESEQIEVDTRQEKSHLQQEHTQALIHLAMLSGMAPVEFSLAPGGYPVNAALSAAVDTPSTLMGRRADVQAAWQRLLAKNAMSTSDSDDASSIMSQIEQAEQAAPVSDALYRRSVLAALQEVELAIAGWRTAEAEQKSAHDTLDLHSANVRDIRRAVTAGRLSRVELLKAEIAENQAQENVLLAAHARNLAFSALQLALASD